MLRAYPTAAKHAHDDEAVADITWVRQFILGVRQIRGEMDISPGKLLPVILQNASDEDRRRANDHAPLLHRVGRVESVKILDEGEEPPASATALMDDMRLLVPMKGIIDVDAERGRLERQQDKLNADLARNRAKLDNANFVNNAPPNVVTKEKQRSAEFEKQLTQLSEQLRKLNELA
jgi:valyl-tRNA synthetase